MTRNKLLIIGAGAFASVVVIAALIFLYITVWSQPTKKDFTDAKVAAEKITTYKGTELLSDFSKTIIAEYQAGKSKEQLIEAGAGPKGRVEEALANRQELADKIGQSKVMKDNETKRSYDIYLAREKRYATYLRNITNFYPSFASSYYTCEGGISKYINSKVTENSQFGELHKTGSKDCLEDLEALSKSPVTPYVEYANEYKGIIAERQKIYDSISNGSVTQKDGIVQIFTAAAKKDPTVKLEQYGKEETFNNELSDFISVLDAKIKASN